MRDKGDRAYMLVAIKPGKQQEFADEIVSLGLTLDTAVDKMDFVHGSYDFIVTFSGTMNEIDDRIMEIRSLPYLLRTETLIPFRSSRSLKGPSKRHGWMGGSKGSRDFDSQDQDSARMNSPIYMGKMHDATHPLIIDLGPFY